MSASRRSFFKLAAAVPFAAPEIARAAHAEFDNIRARALFGECKPLDIAEAVREQVIKLEFDKSKVADIRELIARINAHRPMQGDASVLDQMRDHDIFDLDEVAA